MLKWYRKTIDRSLLKGMAKRWSAIATLSILLTPVATANVVGADTQNFNPTTSGLDFVTVQSSETLESGYFNFGLFLNQAVNTLPHFEESDGSRSHFSDSLLGADLNFGIGILSGWDLGISVPQVLHQKVESEGFRGQFGDNGNTEIRVNSKVRLWGTRDYGIALIGTTNINRIANNPYAGSDPGPTYNMELVADTTVADVALAVNAGYRWRKSGSKLDDGSPIEPLGNQVIASAAASYLFSSIDSKLIWEIFGSRPAGKGGENSDRLESSAETLVGVKYDATTSIAFHGGAGTELIHGRGSPDWRAYLGINYSTGPKFNKPTQPSREPEQFSKKDPFTGPPRASEKIVIHDILFEFDSDSLVIGSVDSTLKKLVHHVNKKPGYRTLTIEGHTDSIGTVEYNMDLSRRRAQTIRTWLIQRYKLDPRKVIAAGKGESRPIANNGNFQGRQLNRRVEFLILRDM